MLSERQIEDTRPGLPTRRRPWNHASLVETIPISKTYFERIGTLYPKNQAWRWPLNTQLTRPTILC